MLQVWQKRSSIVAAILSLSASAAFGQLTLTDNSVVDPRGTTLSSRSPYGENINGQTGQRQALTSFNGYQYAIYYVTAAETAPQAHVAVARRKLPGGPWQVIELKDAAIKNGVFKGTTEPNDSHNAASLDVCPKDGTIHIAYDHHNHPLRYRVTATGAATEPETAKWDASLFLPERSDLVDGKPVNGVSYPSFLRTPAGDLQLIVRLGHSGRASTWLFNYDGASHRWTDGWPFEDGTVGLYDPVTPPSKDRSAYYNDFTYGPDGKLHATFVWRESPTRGRGGNGANHDISYIYSEDNGKSWKNNAGQLISDKSGANGLSKRVTIDLPGLLVVPKHQWSSMINGQGQAVDSTGRVHVLMYHLDPAKTDVSVQGGRVWRTDDSSYFHYWRADDGTWRSGKIDARVGNRPKIAFDQNDNAYAVFSNGPKSGIRGMDRDLVIAVATKAADWADWKVVHTQKGPFLTEPLIDTARLASDGVLSIWMQDSPKKDAEATAIRVFDFTTLAGPRTEGQAPQ